MTAQEVLQELRRRRVDVFLVGEQPRLYDTAGQLDQDLVELAKTHRWALVELLKAEPIKAWKERWAGYPPELRRACYELASTWSRIYSMDWDEAQLMADTYARREPLELLGPELGALLLQQALP